jgi:hypothetical protein
MFAGLANFKLLPELLSASKTGNNSLPTVDYQNTTNLPTVNVINAFAKVFMRFAAHAFCSCKLQLMTAKVHRLGVHEEASRPSMHMHKSCIGCLSAPRLSLHALC